MTWVPESLEDGESKAGRNGRNLKHVISGILAATVTSYIFVSFPFVDNEIAPVMVIFDFFYVSLTFPLDGALGWKMLLFVVGNVIGILWNRFLSSVAQILTVSLGQSATTLHMALSPMLNLFWIISFWSVSLAIISNSKKRNAVLPVDDD